MYVSPARAATEYGGPVAEQWFLKVDGITGESTAAKYPGAIEVESWTWGVVGGVSSGTGGGAGAGKATFQDLHVSTRISKASPPLLKACATGTHIKTVTLHGVKAGAKPQEFLTYTLSDVVITAVQQGDADSGAPLEHVTFGYRKVKVDYRPQKADGTLAAAVTFGYDVAANKKL
jgi:type VI secretion system secreted protein Hcp